MSPVIVKNKCDVMQSKYECGNRGLINSFKATSFLKQHLSVIITGLMNWQEKRTMRERYVLMLQQGIPPTLLAKRRLKKQHKKYHPHFPFRQSMLMKLKLSFLAWV